MKSTRQMVRFFGSLTSPCCTGPKYLSIEKSQSLFQDAFAAVWEGFLEDDGFNALVLQSGLTGREVSVLRAYHTEADRRCFQPRIV